jgi:hypothetical protein
LLTRCILNHTCRQTALLKILDYSTADFYRKLVFMRSDVII